MRIAMAKKSQCLGKSCEAIHLKVIDRQPRNCCNDINFHNDVAMLSLLLRLTSVLGCSVLRLCTFFTFFHSFALHAVIVYS